MKTDKTQSTRQEFTDRSPASRRRRWFLLLTAIALIGFVVWRFWLAPAAPQRPKTLVRDEYGVMRGVDGHGEDAPGLEVQAARIEASNAFDSSSSTRRFEDARLRMERIALFNDSEHPLMKRVCAEVLKGLEGLDEVNRIEFYPRGHKPAVGEMAPDVYVKLDLSGVKETSLLVRHELEAEVHVRAGGSFAHPDGIIYGDSRSPPIVEFSFDGTLHHKSTTIGLSSSAAKYKLAGENIASQIAATLTDSLTQWLRKSGRLPELPEAFYPHYEPPPAFGFLEDIDAELLVSTHGLMTPNESTWQFDSERDIEDLFADIRDSLAPGGWTSDGQSTHLESGAYLRLRQGPLTLMVFPKDKGFQHSRLLDRDAATEPQAKTYYVQYTSRMAGADRRAAVQGLLDDPETSIDTLMMFRSYLSNPQRKRLLELLKKRPPTSVRGWLTLANLFRRAGQADQSRAALVRAWYLLWTIGDQADYSNKIRENWKKLGKEPPFEKPQIDESILKELGFIKVEGRKPLPETIVALDEPVVFYSLKNDGTPRVSTIRCTKENGRFRVHFVEAQEGTRSWGAGPEITVRHPARRLLRFDGLSGVELTVTQLPTEDRFRITATAVAVLETKGK